MSKRTKIILGIIGGLVLILLLVILWLWLQRDQASTPTPAEENVVERSNRLPVPSRTTVPGGSSSPVIGQPDIEATLLTVAKTFAERFGSYSNQGGFTNLEDLQSLMTLRMQSNLTDAQNTQRGTETGYVGVTTAAISTNITAFDSSFGQATIEVTTQRRETKGTTNNPRVYYQTIILELIQSGDGWKVDEAVWQ